MIAKKIRNPRKSSSKHMRIQRLVDYVRNPKSKDQKEKCVYEGTRHFFEEGKKAQVKEMQDLAHVAARSKDPINHYVISWKSNEKPTPEQIERTVDVVLDELKMKDHKVIYALHADTKHHHLHLVVNRVHPETEKVNRAFGDYEGLHRAVAKLEHEQGWEKEKKARYQVQENGELRRNTYEDKEKQPTQEKRDRERKTNTKSAERVAQENAPSVIRKARSWRELHENLAKEGMRLEKKGSGAVLFVDKVPVKASSVGREFSAKALQRRLGAFEAAQTGTEVRKKSPEPLETNKPRWQDYQVARSKYEETKRQAVDGFRIRQATEKEQLRAAYQVGRDRMLSVDWKGRGRELNQQRHLLAGNKVAAQAQLRGKQAIERRELRQKYPPFPSFQQWSEKEASRFQERAEHPHVRQPELPHQVAQERLQQETQRQQEAQQKQQERARREGPER